jgi:hypothetical protein
MRIKDAPGHFDLSNGGAGESDTYKTGEKYVDYELVKGNFYNGKSMSCMGKYDNGTTWDDLKTTFSVSGRTERTKVCPTDGAPFEVFSTNVASEYKGKYHEHENTQHTANGQSVRTYHHDLDNTTLTFRACDDNKQNWAYTRTSFKYKKEVFNITHLIPPQEQIHELDVTKPVNIPANLGAFRFFGVDYYDVKMSGHGYISFGGTVGDDFTESISEWGKYKMVAALWDDLNPAGGYNPDKVMGIAKNVYAVHEKVENHLIFQWHFIPETSKDWRWQQTNDENVFRITLDFDTNDILIKTGTLESKDGIVGITGGLDSKGVQYGHHHVDFTSDVGCYTL